MSEWHQILCDSYEIRRLCDENGDSWRELATVIMGTQCEVLQN